ncbi:hypothetical protein LSH36_843g00060 [Paralvinella palmiformis]|uniref:Ras-GEF domain-containing protein n=1 Tax=Paralvinella palmiformis TaxID=53620 RepID=A0AAD9IYT3_9ANNE|nr:hypothetical protein LSH36_843g00060 [Paralvinella palmiformis]
MGLLTAEETPAGISHSVYQQWQFYRKTLIYEDGNLVAGSIEALIQHLVPTPHYKPDSCIYQQNLMSENISKEALAKFGPHLIQLLGEWTDNFPYDFRDERMMRCLKDMTQRLIMIYPELRKDVGIIMHNLICKLSGLHKYEELLTRINAEVAQRLLNIMPTTDIYEVCPQPLVLAQQLTHIELERLSMIGPEEFVQVFVKETEKDNIYKDVKKTNNFESYVQWFNRLSYFVATEICMHLKKKNRVRLVEYFIDVAKECINIGNFNSLMAIIAGLSMNPIQRLKKTWDKVHKEKFQILEHQMNPSNNFTSYRSSLKAALWRSEGAVEERQKIVIPFFSLFVKDMHFLNEGCANKLENGHLNFQKFWQLAKQISEFIMWKQVDCPFDRHPPVLNYLLTNPVFSENSLSLASFECESPEKSFEKQRYKDLREQAGL